jgi:hypothetical protein
MVIKWLLSFMDDVERMDKDQPLRIAFESRLVWYVKNRWGIDLLKKKEPEPASLPGTIQELRDKAAAHCFEADRLEALPDAKRVYSIRQAGKIEQLFSDKDEKDVRYWALSNPNDKNQMFEEWWVKDPNNGEKLRLIKSIPMDVPTVTARQGVAQ